MTRHHLIFVYNADSGLFNTLADIGHKIFSPESYDCRLCALTHGYLSERREWRSFIESLDAACDFMHRDEFRRRWPDVTAKLPAVFRLGESSPVPCLDAAGIEGCADIDELQTRIRGQCLADAELDNHPEHY